MNGMAESKRTAADYMSRALVVLAPEMNLFRAMHALLAHDVSGAPVVDAHGELVGMLTEKDCFHSAYQASYHRELVGPVSRYMSRAVETVSADTDVVDVIELFYRSSYRRFPVVSGNRLVGVISRRDVLRALAELW